MLGNLLNTVGLYSLHLQDDSGVDLYYSLLAVSEQDALERAAIKKPECRVIGVKKPDGGVADISPAALSSLVTANNWLYMVIMFSDAGKSNVRDSRCVGLFADKALAVRLLKENNGDLREQGRYNFAAIEPTSLGLYPHTDDVNTNWYMWSEASGAFEQIATPEDMLQTCNLGVG
tara:strand:+ start:18940 stop:19464 length:525 start_codon:yes stop_codon:yes gene_type:complete